MIQIKKLVKKFGALTVLDGVSTDIKKGEVISIIGPSGCGKSTLLRCINLLERPTSGEIFVDGVNILAKGVNVNKLRQKTGMVFQSFNLYSHLMVIENIMLGPIKLLHLPRQEAFEAGMKYLEIVGLASKALAYPDELSGGQKQRVAIARTLAMKPEVILFDEPTSALDPTMVSEVLAVIRKLASEGLTMLIVTHEMKFARDVSTRILFMDECGIYEDGSPADIFDHPQRSKTRAFVRKIRTFQYTVKRCQFDLYELNGKLEEFLKRQMFTDKRINMVHLIVEELLCNVITAEQIELIVEHSDETNVTQLAAIYDGGSENPFKRKESDLAAMLIEKSAQSVSHAFEDGRNVVTIVLG